MVGTRSGARARPNELTRARNLQVASRVCKLHTPCCETGTRPSVESLQFLVVKFQFALPAQQPVQNKSKNPHTGAWGSSRKQAAAQKTPHLSQETQEKYNLASSCGYLTSSDKLAVVYVYLMRLMDYGELHDTVWGHTSNFVPGFFFALIRRNFCTKRHFPTLVVEARDPRVAGMSAGAGHGNHGMDGITTPWPHCQGPAPPSTTTPQRGLDFPHDGHPGISKTVTYAHTLGQIMHDSNRKKDGSHPCTGTTPHDHIDQRQHHLGMHDHTEHRPTPARHC